MSRQPENRQALYDRIRESTRDEVILEEMIRLGFWPLQGVLPEDPADEIRRRAKLETELNELRTQDRQLHNIEALKREVRKKRLAESRQRQQETKERREQERLARAKAWREQQASRIGYLGQGVSGGLNHTASDVAKLEQTGLPLLHTPLDLANAMEISLSRLRFLAFTRTTSKVSHYVQFHLPKKSGGQRLISAPKARLKAVQNWILRNILERLPIHDTAHGFVPRRSIVTNATPHVGAEVVVNLDLKDFFPTVSYKRVKGLFRSLGYSDALATIMGLLSTEPRSRPVELDGEVYQVAVDERVLPQGSPASPAITNLICRGLDQRLTNISTKLGLAYTRYADDLSFSGNRQADVGKLLRQVKHAVAEEGFSVHPKKTRVFRKPNRQEVTGIVVNEKATISRRTLRRFRAVLFQLEQDGPEGIKWGQSDDPIAAVEGFANYVAMVNPDKGILLQARAAALVERYGRKTAFRPKQTTANPPEEAGTSEPEPDGSKKKNWWKIW